MRRNEYFGIYGSGLIWDWELHIELGGFGLVIRASKHRVYNVLEITCRRETYQYRSIIAAIIL